MVVGSTLSGKSTITTTLAHAIEYVNKDKAIKAFIEIQESK